MRFQNRHRSISGPKAAPKPAHANDVMPKIVELEFQAIAMATMVMSTSVMREHHMTCFSVASFLNTPRYRFWLTALAEISRYESEDEIAAASTPAQAKPARIGGR